MSTIAEEPVSILANSTVSGAIREVAGDNEETWGLLQERAVEVVQVALNLAANAGKELPEMAFVDIACQAVRTMEPVKAAGEVYQALVGWLGPVNVPSKLGFSWCPAQPTLRKEAKAKASAKSDEVATEPSGKILGEIPTTWKEAVAGQPQPPADEPLSDAEAGQIVAMADEVSLADRALLASYDAVRAAGHIEGLEFMRRVSEVAIAQRFAQARADKAWKGLPYRDQDGRIKRVESFDEYCRAFLGKSYNRCQELAQTLHLLGPALYEQAQSIGFKAKDYRALKALPAEEQEVVKQALESESKEQVLDILQEMAARHSAEREALQKSEAELKADLEAKDALLQSKTERADKLAVELEKLKRLPPAEAWKRQLEIEADAVQRIDVKHIEALGPLKTFLTEVGGVLESEDVTEHTKLYAQQVVNLVCEHLTDYLREYVPGISLEDKVNPAWMRETAAAELQESKK